MPNFINLPSFTEEGDINVVIETPRGSRAKFSYDPDLKAFSLSKSLLTGLTYPHDWGFVPSTRADDGDPLDIMVIHDAATFPGLVIACRVIAFSRSNRKANTRPSATIGCSRCRADRIPSKVLAPFRICRSRFRTSWKNSSSPLTS
jgi:hypothetical protein